MIICSLMLSPLSMIHSSYYSVVLELSNLNAARKPSLLAVAMLFQVSWPDVSQHPYHIGPPLALRPLKCVLGPAYLGSGTTMVRLL